MSPGDTILPMACLPMSKDPCELAQGETPGKKSFPPSPDLDSHRESVLDADRLRDNEGANGEFATKGEDGEDTDGLPGLRRALNGLYIDDPSAFDGIVGDITLRIEFDDEREREM